MFLLVASYPTLAHDTGLYMYLCILMGNNFWIDVATKFFEFSSCQTVLVVCKIIRLLGDNMLDIVCPIVVVELVCKVVYFVALTNLTLIDVVIGVLVVHACLSRFSRKLILMVFSSCVLALCLNYL